MQLLEYVGIFFLHLGEQLFEESEDAWLQKIFHLFSHPIHRSLTDASQLKTFFNSIFIGVVLIGCAQALKATKEQCKLGEVARDLVEV